MYSVLDIIGNPSLVYNYVRTYFCRSCEKGSSGIIYAYDFCHKFR